MKYCYKTPSGKCEARGEEVVPKDCDGRFEINKPMAEGPSPEECRFCGATLIKDLQAERAGVQFKGQGFHVTDYRKE